MRIVSRENFLKSPIFIDIAGATLNIKEVSPAGQDSFLEIKIKPKTGWVLVPTGNNGELRLTYAP